jgi:N-glycosylase/DNA lyase
MNDISKKIGKTAEVKLKTLVFKVKILDYKFSYGRDRWLVAPVAGSGQMWIENVKFTD